MYRYGKQKSILKQLRECWENNEPTAYFSGKFELISYSYDKLPQWEFIDEIESIDRTAWELISKRLKGKSHGGNMVRNI